MYSDEPTSRELLLQRAMHRTYGPTPSYSRQFELEPDPLELDREPERMLNILFVIVWTLFLVISGIAIHLWMTNDDAVSKRFRVSDTDHGIILVDRIEGHSWRMIKESDHSRWAPIPKPY